MWFVGPFEKFEKVNGYISKHIEDFRTFRKMCNAHKNFFSKRNVQEPLRDEAYFLFQ